MRRKLVFLTLAVVMLLAVLTISASAEDPQLEVWMDGSYAGERSGTVGSETNPFASYCDLINWIKKDTVLPTWQGTYDVGNDVTFNEYMTKTFGATQSSWPSRVLVHLSGSTVDTLGKVSTVFPEVGVGGATTTGNTTIAGKAITVRLEGTGSSNTTFTISSNNTYINFIDNMEFSKLKVQLETTAKDDKGNLKTWSSLYFAGRTILIDDDCVFKSSSNGNCSLYMLSTSDGVSTIADNKTYRSASLTINSGSFSTVNVVTSAVIKEVDDGQPNIVFTMNGGTVTTLTCGGSSSWYKDNGGIKNEVLIDVNGGTITSFYGGYNAVLKPDYNTSDDASSGYKFAHCATPAYNLTATFDDCTISTAYSAGGKGSAALPMTYNGSFDITYTNVTFTATAYAVWTDATDKYATFNGPICVTFNNCQFNRNLLGMYNGVVINNDLTIIDNGSVHSGLATLKSGSTTEYEHTTGTVSLLCTATLNGDFNAEFTGCTFWNSVYTLGDGLVTGDVATTFDNCVFKKNSATLPDRPSLKANGARYYLTNGKGTITGNAVTTFKDSDVWIDFLINYSPTITGDCITNLTGSTTCGQYYTGGSGNRTLTTSKIKNIVTNIMLDEDGSISNYYMNGYASGTNTNRIGKTTTNVESGKITNFYVSNPGNTGTSIVDEAVLNVDGGVISNFYVVYNPEGTASVGSFTLNQTDGIIGTKDVGNVYGHGYTLSQTGGHFLTTVGTEAELKEAIDNANAFDPATASEDYENFKYDGIMLTADIKTTIDLNAADKTAYKPFQTSKTSGEIELNEPFILELNGKKLTTDNLRIYASVTNSDPENGGLYFGVRSSGLFNSVVSDAKSYDYLDLIPTITMLSGHFNEGSGKDAIMTVPAGKVFTITATNKGMVLKSITLEPGATLEGFTKIYASEGVIVQCATLDDLNKTMPPLVDSYETSGKGTLTGGVDHIDYVLTDDITTTEDFEVPTGAVLDLAGKTLTCKSIDATTGKVIDTVGGGKLIVSDGIANSFVGDNNGYLPLFDGTGYQFFLYSVIQRTTPVLDEGSGLLNCMFRFEFTDANAYALLAAGNSGLTLNFDLNCANGTKPYRFSEDTLKAYGQAYVDNREGHFAISVKLDGYAESGNFSTEFSLQTEAGAAASAAAAQSQSVIG